MTKCLSCGHLRHDLELNCPKCGSFYSTISHDFSSDVVEQNKATKTLSKVKHEIERVQQIGRVKMAELKARCVIVGIIIFLIVALVFL